MPIFPRAIWLVAFLSCLLGALRIGFAADAEEAARIATAKEKLGKDPKFILLVYTCKLCQSIEKKNDLEDELKTDMAYAKKYGVINYGRRDYLVQLIRKTDKDISADKQGYREDIGKAFNSNICDKIYLDTCDGDIEQLEAELLEKYMKE